MTGLGSLGLGRVGTRVAIGLVTLLGVGAVGVLVSPALAQGRAAPVSLKAPSAAAMPEVEGPSATIGSPLSTSASLQPTFVPPFEMSYGKGTRQTYLAYLPGDRTSDMAVVLIHGGGWVSGKAEDTQQYNQRLYNEGIASFSIDYRFATEAVWPAQRKDLAASLADIRKNAQRWGIDPNKIALIGVSAGGQMALDLASRTGKEATCGVVSYSGPTSMDLLLADAATGIKQRGLAEAVRDLAPGKKARESASVPHSPSPDDAPALLYASQYDWVDPANTTQYADSYAGIDLDVQSIVLPGERRHASGYALSDPQVWTGSMDFLRRHCG